MVPWGGRATFIFIFLIFLAVLGLCCCAARGLSLVAVSRAYSSLWCTGFSLWWLLLLQSTGSRPVASVVVAHGLISCGLRALEHRLSSCGAWAQLLCGMCDFPGPGIEPVSPALAGGFLTTVPPGKPSVLYLNKFWMFFKNSSGEVLCLRAVLGSQQN